MCVSVGLGKSKIKPIQYNLYGKIGLKLAHLAHSEGKITFKPAYLGFY